MAFFLLEGSFRWSDLSTYSGSPTVLRVVAEHAPGFIDGKERLIWANLFLERHAWINFSEQFRVGSSHHGIGVCDDCCRSSSMQARPTLPLPPVTITRAMRLS